MFGKAKPNQFYIFFQLKTKQNKTTPSLSLPPKKR